MIEISIKPKSASDKTVPIKTLFNCQRAPPLPGNHREAV